MEGESTNIWPSAAYSIPRQCAPPNQEQNSALSANGDLPSVEHGFFHNNPLALPAVSGTCGGSGGRGATPTDNNCGGRHRWFHAARRVCEEGTLAAQRGHRDELIQPFLDEYHGRIANTGGDRFLIGYSTAVVAVRCSTVVEDAMPERNRDIPSELRVEYRIAINLGNALAEGEDLLGDGVNIAYHLARIIHRGHGV